MTDQWNRVDTLWGVVWVFWLGGATPAIAGVECERVLSWVQTWTQTQILTLTRTQSPPQQPLLKEVQRKKPQQTEAQPTKPRPSKTQSTVARRQPLEFAQMVRLLIRENEILFGQTFSQAYVDALSARLPSETRALTVSGLKAWVARAFKRRQRSQTQASHDLKTSPQVPRDRDFAASIWQRLTDATWLLRASARHKEDDRGLVSVEQLSVLRQVDDSPELRSVAIDVIHENLERFQPIAEGYVNRMIRARKFFRLRDGQLLFENSWRRREAREMLLVTVAALASSWAVVTTHGDLQVTGAVAAGWGLYGLWKAASIWPHRWHLAVLKRQMNQIKGGLAVEARRIEEDWRQSERVIGELQRERSRYQQVIEQMREQNETGRQRFENLQLQDLPLTFGRGDFAVSSALMTAVQALTQQVEANTLWLRHGVQVSRPIREILRALRREERRDHERTFVVNVMAEVRRVLGERLLDLDPVEQDLQRLQSQVQDVIDFHRRALQAIELSIEDTPLETLQQQKLNLQSSLSGVLAVQKVVLTELGSAQAWRQQIQRTQELLTESRFQTAEDLQNGELSGALASSRQALMEDLESLARAVRAPELEGVVLE